MKNDMMMCTKNLMNYDCALILRDGLEWLVVDSLGNTRWNQFITDRRILLLFFTVLYIIELKYDIGQIKKKIEGQ